MSSNFLVHPSVAASHARIYVLSVLDQVLDQMLDQALDNLGREASVFPTEKKMCWNMNRTVRNGIVYFFNPWQMLPVARLINSSVKTGKTTVVLLHTSTH